MHRWVANLPFAAVQVVVAKAASRGALVRGHVAVLPGLAVRPCGAPARKGHAFAGRVVAALPGLAVIGVRAGARLWHADVTCWAAHLAVLVAEFVPVAVASLWLAGVVARNVADLPAFAVRVALAAVLEVGAQVALRVAQLERVSAFRVGVAVAGPQHALLLHSVAGLVCLAALVARAAALQAA